MQDGIVEIVALSISILVLTFAAGVKVGCDYGEKHVRQEAIIHYVAYWQADTNGAAIFTWYPNR